MPTCFVASGPPSYFSVFSSMMRIASILRNSGTAAQL